MPKKLNASEEAWYTYAKIKKDDPHKINRELHERFRWSQYADDVSSGKKEVCKWVQLAVKRQFNDLKNLHKEGYHFDPVAAASVVGFFPDYLKHYKGEFNGQSFDLGPWQQFITACIFGWKNAEGFRRFNKVYVECPRKSGKALALNTPIATPDGWTTMGDIEIGDTVFDKKGNQTKVIFTTDIMYNHDCYEVTFSDGEKIIADAGHLWETIAKKTHNGKTGSIKKPKLYNSRGYAHFSLHNKLYYVCRWDNPNKYKIFQEKLDKILEIFPLRKSHVAIRTTEEIEKTLRVDNPYNIENNRIEWNHKIEVAAPLIIEPVKLLIPPYVLGCWIGDGDSAAAQYTINWEDKQILDEIKKEGITVGKERKQKNSNNTYRVTLGSLQGADVCRRGHPKQLFWTKNRKNNRCILCERIYERAMGDNTLIPPYMVFSLNETLKNMGLLKNKHIPSIYLRGSYKQRLDLLQGLLDTDGTIDKRGNCVFTTIKLSLAKEVSELARTLGLKPTIGEKRAICNGKDCGIAYNVQFIAYTDLWSNQNMPVFRLKRKLDRQKRKLKRKTRASFRQIISVKKIKSVPVKCIQVDSSSGLFLTGKSMIPTHNSTWFAGLGIYLFLPEPFENEPGAEVYVGATKLPQAKICHNDAKEMIKRSPKLNNMVTILRDNIHIIETASKFEPLCSESKKLDGLNVSAAIIDEVHAHADRDLWGVLETGIGARRQPLMLGITTAGTNKESICHDLKTYTEKLLELPDEFKDESFFGIVYTIDEGDNWEDEASWKKANPNLDISCKSEDLRQKAVKARNMPAELSNFLRKHLDVWTESENPWLNMRLWRECNDEVDPEKLIGRDCYIGIDLASVLDITAMTLLFPPVEPDEKIKLISHFWIPGDNVYDRVHKDKVPYDTWIRQGYIHTTPGNVMDYDYIEATIEKEAEKYKVLEIAYDPYNAMQLMAKLQDKGFECVKITQTWNNMSPPAKELETLIYSKQIAHGNNPVLTWMMSNTVVHIGPSGNYKPDKRKSNERIDGVISTIMALSRMVLHVDQTSIYASRGVLAF